MREAPSFVNVAMFVSSLSLYNTNDLRCLSFYAKSRTCSFIVQKLDGIHTVEEVQSLHDEMVMDYTEKMRRYFRDNTYSKHINASKEYIYSHIKERITIEDLADSLGVSASYLSRLFKKETGISVSAYIRRQKIEMAKNLLQYSDYPIIEIANRLSFSSQSHFIQQFREVTGMTPGKYRDEHYMIHWDIEKELCVASESELKKEQD